jgi:hypothetical protein
MALYLSATARVHLMCGFTDMRNGVNGLFSLANNILSRDGEESIVFLLFNNEEMLHIFAYEQNIQQRLS